MESRAWPLPDPSMDLLEPGTTMALIARSGTPERPTPRINVAAIPAELRVRAQWVVWRKVIRQGKATKVPFQALLPHEKADSSNSTTWSTFQEALDALADPRNRLDGIGFVFSPDDAYAGIDLDNCLDEEGTMQAWARAVLDRLPGYAEISPSGRGVKLFVVGSVPFGKGRKIQKLGDGSGAIEAYDRGRYFTVTGYLFETGHSTLGDAQDELDTFHAAYFPPPEDRPRLEPSAPTLDDAAIVHKAMQALHGAEFARLWEGDTSAFPSKSEADLSLCSRIAFYTQDSTTIERIFGQSGLVDSKWQDRPDYRNRTIDKALFRTTIHDAKYNSQSLCGSTIPANNPFYSPEAKLNTEGEEDKKYYKSKKQSPRDTSAREAEDQAFRSEDDEESEAEEAPSGSWSKPRLDGPEPSPAFPLDALPEALQGLLLAVAESMACPVDFPAVAALGIASGAMGRSVAIRIKEGWIETPGLYLGAVGDPGMTKSPPLAMLARPLWELTHAQLKYHKLAIDQHRQRGKKDDPEPPPPRRVIVDEVTVEALAGLLGDNPRGLVMVKDELSSLFAGMNQYKSGGKGNDRQFFLSAWSGQAVAVDRKNAVNRRPVTVSHPFLSIVGGLTPDMLSELGEARGRDDGFLDRMLFAAPERISVRWSDRGVPTDLETDWSNALGRLWDVPMTVNGEGRPRPWFVGFTPEAHAIYKDWFNAHQIEAEDEDFPSYLRGPWAKFRGYAARLALLIDRLGRAFDPEGLTGPIPDVDVQSLTRALLLTSYFETQTRRVRAMMRGSFGDCPDARKILNWAIRRNREQFKAAEVRQNFRRTFPVDGPELERALTWLTGRFCIRPVLAHREKSGPGRPASLEYEVNPALLGELRADD